MYIKAALEYKLPSNSSRNLAAAYTDLSRGFYWRLYGIYLLLIRGSYNSSINFNTLFTVQLYYTSYSTCPLASCNSMRVSALCRSVGLLRSLVPVFSLPDFNQLPFSGMRASVAAAACTDAQQIFSLARNANVRLATRLHKCITNN